MLTLNSDYIYETRLGEYPYLLRDLTRTYGGPPLKKFLEKRGRRMLIDILKHLTNQKQCTCEVIAQEKFNKIRKEKRKLKSLTDDVRKFIQKNLIPRRVVVVDGTKKVYNKDVTVYSLTPFGILYSIHFLSRNKKDDRIIRKLSVSHKDTLPKVFGMFPNFKKKLGYKFIVITGLRQIAEIGDGRLYNFSTTPPEALLDLVRDYNRGWSGAKSSYSDRWETQISLMVYCNILYYFYNKAFREHMNNWNFNHIPFEVIFNNLWNDLIDSDPEIRKWFSQFFKQAIQAYKKRSNDVRVMKSWLKTSARK